MVRSVRPVRSDLQVIAASPTKCIIGATEVEVWPLTVADYATLDGVLAGQGKGVDMMSREGSMALLSCAEGRMAVIQTACSVTPDVATLLHEVCTPGQFTKLLEAAFEHDLGKKSAAPTA